MRDPEMFRYDVRVRERMMKAGRLTPDELAKQLAGLVDVESNAASIELEQPALGRADGVGSTRASVPPPALSTADRDAEGAQGSMP
jgi:hypothetical protein